MILYKFPCGPLKTNAILFGISHSGAVVDPSMGSTVEILRRAEENNLRIEKILLTHSHWDHIADVKVLKEKTGALLYVHPLDAKNVETPGSDGLPLFFQIQGTAPDRFLKEEETVQVGSLRVEVIHTPGHSPGSVCLYLKDQNILISGDTLFCGGIGRLDLPTGDPEAMERSLRKLAGLPPQTRVIPGHGPDTELGKENVKRFYN